MIDFVLSGTNHTSPEIAGKDLVSDKYQVDLRASVQIDPVTPAPSNATYNVRLEGRMNAASGMSDRDWITLHTWTQADESQRYRYFTPQVDTSYRLRYESGNQSVRGGVSR